MYVDRPTGDPSVESGAGLFAQLVKSQGPRKGSGGGREADAAAVNTLTVSKVK